MTLGLERGGRHPSSPQDLACLALRSPAPPQEKKKNQREKRNTQNKNKITTKLQNFEDGLPIL
jgi:hypothetical protein